LFFCHLTIEKILKACYVKHNQELAPKIYKLQYLAEHSNIKLDVNHKEFFGVLMQFQIEGRYPETYPPNPTEQDAPKNFYRNKTYTAMADTKIISVVKKYMQALNNNGINIEHAFLYGSYARGEATAESDIDVLLVSDYFDTADIYKFSKPWTIAADIDYRIEPVSIASSRFQNDESSPLIATVKQEGVEIKL
jgi:predicted nucleotidyltransferase